MTYTIEIALYEMPGFEEAMKLVEATKKQAIAAYDDFLDSEHSIGRYNSQVRLVDSKGTVVRINQSLVTK